MPLEFPITDPILQFTVLTAAALIVRLTLERMHLPGLVGLLAIGAVAGPGGLGLLPREPVVELLGSVGLVFIMFLAGAEVDLDILAERRQETLTFGLSAFALSLAPAIGVGLLAGYGWSGALPLGAALCSHTLLTYPIVERLGLLGRPAVVAAIGGTLLTDTLALVLLVLTVEKSGQGGMWDRAQPLLLLVVLAAVCWTLVPRFSRHFLEHAHTSRPEKALFVLVVILVLSSATELIGTENILGAFLAGVCLNRPIRRRKELHEHLAFVAQMLFIPFFFIDTGMRLELGVFTRTDVWALAAALLGVVVFGKAAASWLTGWLYGYPPWDRGLMVGLTVPQAAATLAVTVIARGAGLFDELLMDAVILLIFLTCLIGPLLTRFAGGRVVRNDKRQHFEHSPMRAAGTE